MSRHYGSRSGGASDPSSGPASGSGAAAVELEQQILLRLPAEPAEALKEALRSGASNIKDRLKIQMEPDKNSGALLRRGSVQFDGWQMSGKLVDLPTIIESQKTIDKKTFYKTADICQIFVCKEGPPSDDEETPADKAKAAANKDKVEKKFVYRHGVCPPLKNCRRRRYEQPSLSSCTYH